MNRGRGSGGAGGEIKLLSVERVLPTGPANIFFSQDDEEASRIMSFHYLSFVVLLKTGLNFLMKCKDELKLSSSFLECQKYLTVF